MTPTQFECCIDSRRGNSASTRAARLVLVDGMRQIDAAAQCGVGTATVSNAVVRIRARCAKIVAAFCAGIDI